MRSLGFVVFAAVSMACGREIPSEPPEVRATGVVDPPSSKPERLSADATITSVAGHTFTAPAGWSVRVVGDATLVAAPEEGSNVVFVDVRAADAVEAVDAAWAAYGRREGLQVAQVESLADKDGWTDVRRFRYQVPPDEKRFLLAEAGRRDDAWQVVLIDMDNAVADKRFAQLVLLFDGRLPSGYVPESFAGKAAHRLDAARIHELTAFLEAARTQLRVPGVSVALVQDGEVVFLGGLGVRELGKPAKVDGDTKFMIASNTKALTTLMLATLVDDKRISWDSPVVRLLPSFKLGDAETTAKVQVKHLVCACTGLPRQDNEWFFEFGGLTPRDVVDGLATAQPTSGFGELYQYSNTLAAAAGFIGGHVAYPKLELGKAYDEAMRSRVFGPLHMRQTTFDQARGQRGNWARAHAPDIDGTLTRVDAVNGAAVPIRPSGAAWSTARDMAAYIQMELAQGRLPNGDRYVSRAALVARQEPQISSGRDATYGMGLEVETKFGVRLVHHGGVWIGYFSDMMWLPEHGVGAVILTNAEPGWAIHDAFKRKLLEVLFDGKPTAEAQVSAAAKGFREGIAARRERLQVPIDSDVAAGLATSYASVALGEVTVHRTDGKLVLDFGEWKTEVASRENADGTVSLVMISPGVSSGPDGAELVVGNDEGKRTLTLRDYQHEYVFLER